MFQYFKLKAEIRALEAERDELQEKLDRIQKEQEDGCTGSENFTVDFRMLKPFSIERQVYDGRPCTVIGYFREAAVEPLQWYLYCDDETHQKMIREYNSIFKRDQSCES